MRQTRLVLPAAAVLVGALAFAGGCSKEEGSKKSSEEAQEKKPKKADGCQTIEGTHAPSKRESARKKRPNICRVTGDFIVGRYVETLEGYENLVEIGGKLDIRATGNLKSLKGLSKVKSLGGGLWVRDAYSIGSVDGLDSLTAITGGVHIIGNPELSSVELPALERVEGDVELFGNRSLGAVNLPALVSIMGNLSIVDDEMLSAIDISSVESILGHLSVRGVFEIREISAPKLTKLWGGLDIGMNTELAKLSLPALKNCAGEFLIEHCNKLKGTGDLKSKCTGKGGEEPTYDAVVLYGKNLLIEPFGEQLLEKKTPEKKLEAQRTARLKKAIEVCAKAHAMSQDRTDALLCMAEGHELLKEPDQAIPLYEKVLSLDPKIITAAYKLALIYKEKGELASARKAYQTCIDNGGDSQDAIPCKVEIRELGKQK